MHELSGVDDNNASETGVHKQSTKGKKRISQAYIKLILKNTYFFLISIDHKINNFNLGNVIIF
jgi:hypothetical protein